MRKICTLILLFISLVGFTQNESPKIRFIQDSTMLGELVEVQLMYKHSKELEVLFPDSAYSYFPFEFVKKEAYTTSTKDSISIDSTIYTLQTFELDKIQTLQLDITLFSTKDSFKIKTNTDTIFLVEMIEEISDTTTFKTNTVFNEVETEFNYPYFLIGFGILLILLIIYIIVFGKKTINKIKVWKLKSGYKKF